MKINASSILAAIANRGAVPLKKAATVVPLDAIATDRCKTSSTVPASSPATARPDVKKILSDPVSRKRLMVATIQATQAREGITTTKAQATAAYDKAQTAKASNPVAKPAAPVSAKPRPKVVVPVASTISLEIPPLTSPRKSLLSLGQDGKTGTRFYDADLKRFGTLLDVSPCSARIRWDGKRTNVIKAKGEDDVDRVFHTTLSAITVTSGMDVIEIPTDADTRKANIVAEYGRVHVERLEE